MRWQLSLTSTIAGVALAVVLMYQHYKIQSKV